MIEFWRYLVRRAKLERELEQDSFTAEEAYRNAIREGKSIEEAYNARESCLGSYFFTLEEIHDNETKRLTYLARRFQVSYPDSAEWTKGTQVCERYLDLQAREIFRARINVVRKDVEERVLRYFTAIGAVTSAAIGVIGALIGLLSVINK